MTQKYENRQCTSTKNSMGMSLSPKMVKAKDTPTSYRVYIDYNLYVDSLDSKRSLSGGLGSSNARKLLVELACWSEGGGRARLDADGESKKGKDSLHHDNVDVDVDVGVG